MTHGNLGGLLYVAGDLAGAQAAHEVAIGDCCTQPAIAAALSVWRLLMQAGDIAAADATYQRAVASGVPEAQAMAVLMLGASLASKPAHG